MSSCYTRIYKIWDSMKTRCYNPNHFAYARYGGRGIVLCAAWRHNFHAFEAWALANGYSRALCIDRIDNNGPYSPENCRWVTRRGQANNRHNNQFFAFGGKTQTISQWSRDLGVSRSTLWGRFNILHWPIERALLTPPQGHPPARYSRRHPAPAKPGERMI